MYSLYMYIGSLCNIALSMAHFTCIVTSQVFVKIYMQWIISLSSAIYRGRENIWIVFTFKTLARYSSYQVLQYSRQLVYFSEDGIVAKERQAAWFYRLLKTMGILYKILDGYCNQLNITYIMYHSFLDIGRINTPPNLIYKVGKSHERSNEQHEIADCTSFHRDR